MTWGEWAAELVATVRAALPETPREWTTDGVHYIVTSNSQRATRTKAAHAALVELAELLKQFEAEHAAEPGDDAQEVGRR
jgi:hypothetical protein